LKDIKVLLNRFLPFYRDYKLKFALSILGMIMVALGTASSAAIIKPILDKIFIEKNEEMLYLLPLGIIILYTIKASGAFMQVYFSSYIGQDIVRRLRDRIVDTILSFEMGFFHEFRSGELISRSMNDIERVRQVVSATLPVMSREFLTILALLGYVFYLDPQMALLSIIFIPLTAKPISMIAKKMKKFSHTSQERTSDLTARLSEIFNNIEVIKASAAEQYESKRFEKENQQIFDVNIKATKTGDKRLIPTPTIKAF
jgi:subfamily B ATP-binding cassette protein MsbA